MSTLCIDCMKIICALGCYGKIQVTVQIALKSFEIVNTSLALKLGKLFLYVIYNFVVIMF
jgi:hypothetical protein